MSDRFDIAVPEMTLVVLVGVSGSGKSTFARRHFAPSQVINSDWCRALVSDDENDLSATKDAFDVLHYIVGTRLRRGRLTVVDATNVQPKDRAPLVRIAKEHDVLPVAIVLDVPESVARERNRARTDRDLPDHVVPRQRRDLRAGLRGIGRERFNRVHVLRGTDEIDAATVRTERQWNDKRELTGPFDVIGDVHGCRAELEAVLDKLGWAVEHDDQGRPSGARHPDGRTAVFLGDLVDRGPDSPGVLRLVMGMVAAGTALCVPGNHENKLVRALAGRKVRVSHGLAETLEQLGAEEPTFQDDVRTFCDGLVSHYVLDEGRLVVAHAGLKEAYQGRSSGRVRSFALYGETTGETDEYGLPVRYEWARDYRGTATVVYGHTPVPEAEWVNNTLCIDTGCAFGGRLTALRYPERELVSVPARRVWYESAKPFPPSTEAADAGPAADRRSAGVLDIADVLYVDAVQTAHGRIRLGPDGAAAALEVLGRFAVDPRWLVYLPPTMAPCSTSARPDLLEHPAEAFADYRTDGVDRVVCEEKHMGSRAVVVVCRDEEAAVRRFGFDGAGDDGERRAAGAVYTRTGRPFFADPAVTVALLDRVRSAVGAAGLWDELRTDWLVLDCELMPWSAKAEGLIREQYATVGAAARSALSAASSSLEEARSRGLDVGGLLDGVRRRTTSASAFTDAYRRYCWSVDGVHGLRLAPFQVLAGEGAAYTGHDHGWQLAVGDRLAAADPSGTFVRTGSQVVDVTDPEAGRDAATWWTELTAGGGEGMVVKPLAGLARRGGARSGRGGLGGLCQPGLKVRGPEYLRIIYGPDYAEPDHLARLRGRGLGRKRGLAMREYALGLEAVDRLVRDEPLWRVHQAVFGVLALESEPVDPRL